MGSFSADRVGRFSAHPAAARTFKVVPNHEQLPQGGVRFSVEEVSPPDKDDLHKPVLAPDTLRKRRVNEAKAYYKSEENDHFGYQDEDFTPIRLEAESTAPEGLVYVGSDAFLTTCLTAFARHLPLALTPDHLWSLISYGFAKHVDQNAEALRHHFVQHEGKKRLLVRVDHFSMSGGVKGAGTPAELWERDVFPDFSSQIREHIGPTVHDAIAGSFSTSDNVAKAAHEIVLMSAMKNYFSYGMMTCCGIPQISLMGSREDWVALRTRAEQLSALGEGAGCSLTKWMACLLPVLDEFIAAYDGHVNYGFWQSMVKLRDTGGGSGSYSFISGWIQILYPYLASGRVNGNMRPWQEMYFAGPQLDEFPPISSAAPVDWEYYGVTHNMHFHAGFAGMVQDPASGEVSPALGWHVSHDPPQDKTARLAQVKKEMDDLAAGHAGEAADGAWAHRMIVLRLEHEKLAAALELTDRAGTIRKLQR